MMWQDFVFMAGSLSSVVFLYPTLRDSASQVPRATSVPSMLIGGAYASTFFTLEMSFSALGALAACTMWSLIAVLRAPDGAAGIDVRRRVASAREWIRHTFLRRWPMEETTASHRIDDDAAPNSD